MALFHAINKFILPKKTLPCLWSAVRYMSKKKGGEDSLKSVMTRRICEEREKIIKFRKDCGKEKLGEIIVNQLYGGMRGMLGLVCETSYLDPEKGITFRGLSIPDCQEQLPKAKGGCEPLPEGLFWLILTGEVPTQEQVGIISQEWAERSKLPCHVVDILEAMPKKLHPMAQFSIAITALDSESCFNKALNCGVKKVDYWEYILEDTMDILGKLPVIAAQIYRNVFCDGSKVGAIDACKDWSYNFCQMLGFDNKEFIELMRMYLTIHSDHEGGNVSAHTTHLVGSALSSPALSLSAGINGLAGPLHGLANQTVLIWIREIQKELGDDPSKDELKEFVWRTLKSGQVVPGYGHAVLRKTDPRFSCQKAFAEQYLPDDPTFKVVSKLYKVVPGILKELGKVQNPWPNVDAHSGVLLQYYGLTQMNFYTVLFGVSRAMGVLSQLVWSRAMLFPIERPKSITSRRLIKLVQG